MFLLWLKLSATRILLPQQRNLNVIERKYKRQIFLPDPIILDSNQQILDSLIAQDQLYTLAGVMAWDHGSVRGEARL